MKANIVLLLETLTGILTLFFGALSVMTPWCAWRITCIVLCCVIGVLFITFAVLSRTKFKPVDEPQESAVKEETPSIEEQ